MAKSITGIVASKKTDKTIVVTEAVRVTHPLYRKQYTITKRFMAHDEKNEAAEGDKVVITETRPLSARKHFTLTRIVERGGIRHAEKDETPKVAKKKATVDKKETQEDSKGEEGVSA